MPYAAIYMKDGPESSSAHYRIMQYLDDLSALEDLRVSVRQMAPDWLWRARYNLVGTPTPAWRRLTVRLMYLAIGAIRGTFFMLLDTLRRPDVTVVSRSLFPRTHVPPLSWLYAGLLNASGRVVWDVDDDILSSGELSTREKGLLDSASNIAVITHPDLAAAMRIRRAEVKILPTTDGAFEAWDPEEVLRARSRGMAESLNLIWLGSSSGLQDLALIVEGLELLAQKVESASGRTTTLTVVCNQPLVAASGTLQVRNVRWARSAALEELRTAHVGLMPLSDTQFARGKGAFKLVQYMAAGLPCVASDVGFNRVALCDGAGQLVVGAKPGTWASAIQQLADSNWEETSRASRECWESRFPYVENLNTWRQFLN